MKTYKYNTKEYFVGEWRDVQATIQAQDGINFVVECVSEIEKAVRCFETREQAKSYGVSFNRKADRKNVGATYQIFEVA